MIEQLKEGYKKTEVGIIPNEWTPKTYGELFHFLTTSSFSRDELSEEGEVRCVHYGDIHTKYHQFLDFSNGFNSFIDLERGKKYPFVKDGDIIMADASEDYSGIGKSVEVKNLDDKLAISGLHTFLLRDKNGDFEDGFKAYIHSMAPVKKSMDRLATGLKVYGVSKANLKTVLVPVPPPAEQKAIATALSDVDALITNLDKLIAKKKAIKQGAMQRLLKSPAQGGQRLPGFEGEWVIEKLHKLTRQIIDGTHHTPRYTNRGIPFLRVTDIQSSSIDMTDLKYVSKEEHEILIKRCNPQKGDILLSKNGTIGIPKVVDWDWEFSVFVSLALIKIKDHLLDVSYLSHYLSSDFMKQQIKERSKQGTVTNLHLEEIREFDIPVPPTLDEQRAIDTILTDMTIEINSLENKKTKYIRIKQGMMQELLTGKTRLV